MTLRELMGDLERASSARRARDARDGTSPSADPDGTSPSANPERTSPSADPEITDLAYSSARAGPGTLFFCVPGFRADGHDFAAEAVERGAVAVVSERPLELGVPEVVVPDVRAAMGPAAARFYGDPTRELRVVGITGTNGKTTTAFLVRTVLEAADVRTALLGTVTQIVGGRPGPVERTTPEAIDLQAAFRRMLDSGDEACVMEVSSHALALGRAVGIRYACRVFTNLTQDHLDFHGTMEDYFQAKRRLFEGPGPSVVNVDDAYGRRLAAEVDDVVTFGIESEADSRRESEAHSRRGSEADYCLESEAHSRVESEAHYRARRVRFDTAGSAFTCETPEGPMDVRLPLPGRFNVMNALASLATGRVLGVDLSTARDALAGAARVPGRFEPVDEGQDFAVLVDYAHTPDSLDNVLRAARGVARGRLHVVFGAGGDRDRTKRPLMGEVAARLADRAVVTSDNPRSEDPEAIVRDILAGVRSEVDVEVDRRRAIARAVETAGPGDVVVIAGKGHEQGQEFADGRREPFDDVTVAREALRAGLSAPA